MNLIAIRHLRAMMTTMTIRRPKMTNGSAKNIRSSVRRLGLGAAGLAAAIYYCITNPLACIPTPDIDPPETDPPERERPRPHACIENVDLPSGRLRAEFRNFGLRYFLQRSFRMRVRFRDDPETGCDCSCGEYLQQVRGTFEKNEGSGWQSLNMPPTADGGQVEAGRYKEDARHGRLPYGHRFRSPARLMPRTEEDFDQFVPDMATGCTYEGRDNPGVQLPVPPMPGAEYRVALEFRGTPVDGCNGRLPIPGNWHEWEVVGYGQVPPEEEPPEEEPPEEGPPDVEPPEPQTEPPETTPPPQNDGPSIGPAPPEGQRGRIAPSGFCLNENIACATFHFIMDRHLHLTADEYDQAVRIEYRALRRRCIVTRPFATPLNPAAAANWERWTHGQAAQRVDAFLHFNYGVRDRNYGAICPWR